jgi:hypothetical protein
MQPSKRLQTVLEVGDTLALFPVLKDWPTEELQTLLRDVEEYTESQYEFIEEKWKEMAFRPTVFLNLASSKVVDEIRDQSILIMAIVMAEICSVARFYLGQRGIKPDTPEED